MEVSRALVACGIKKNDKVSIYSYNRKEWNICYASAQFVNAQSLPEYTIPALQVKWSGL
ncbi:MAG: hypothetical protein CM15mP106_6280 [Candidatus Neomarinimicrobiota bacterium]|nr:MAG: hypothetical protein CM15mP106_6280 [Candidatus Neomarinimicrobiota bacterium]